MAKSAELTDASITPIMKLPTTNARAIPAMPCRLRAAVARSAPSKK